MSNYEMEQLLKKLLIDETVDGLFFWGPKLWMSTDTNQYDEVFLSLEGTFILTNKEQVIIVKRNDPNKLQHLCTLAYQKISSLQLIDDNTLRIHFQSGIQLDVLGKNETFESWQVVGRLDEETPMIVAGPGKSLTLFV